MSIDQHTPSRTHPDWESLPDGQLTSVSVGSLPLDNGERIENVTLAFERWGTLSPTRDNVVLALHALTGDAHATGPTGPGQLSPGWWDGLIGPGAAVDTDEWCVISANVLGGCNGSTGPSSLDSEGQVWGSRFPHITVLDQVRAEVALLDALQIDSVAAVLGGSMGGARALEWVIGYPERVRSALILAVGARASADQIGTQTTQIAAIKADANWQNGDYHGTGRTPTSGLGIARRIAHMYYRSEPELDQRFENFAQGQEDPLHGGRYAVQSYLEHQANKLVHRFDPGSYVVLSEVLNHHDVGRGRGGVEAALRSCHVPVVIGGIDSDRLYPLRQQIELAEFMPGCVDGLHVVHSANGHGGFLTEFDAVSDLLKKTLVLARDSRAPGS